MFLLDHNEMKKKTIAIGWNFSHALKQFYQFYKLKCNYQIGKEIINKDQIMLKLYTFSYLTRSIV